jgi:tRNA pseudouridine32 synthase/23S rRNA pseudouridine746 synthase/23S rRNA pseudouridine955/2504/2580 synthase
MTVRVLHRDELVLALDKPPGMLTVPGRGDDTKPLSAFAREIAEGALPVHRLDRDTSGVVLFGIGPAAHRALSRSFEDRRAEKRYLALVRGDVPQPARIDVALERTRRGGMRPARGDAAQRASTEIEPLERFGAVTSCACIPRTGRTHQVRVHLASLGHPLLVDPRYGDAGPLQRGALDPRCTDPGGVALSRTPLHASSIRVPHPSGRGWLRVESPLPDDMAACLELLRAARRR